jgi:hypothetical protein
MKRLPQLSLLYSLLFIVPASSAQSISLNACTDNNLIHQADSIKQEYARQGFIVIKEATMNMESEFEIPVIVPLTESVQYQFVFIGDASSGSYQVKMFDWDEKQVACEKKESANGNDNVISYAYTPKISEYHMIKSVQVNKRKKNVCGYVLLLKKVKQ